MSRRKLLSRLCGLDMRKNLRGEHLLSRAFRELAEQGVVQQAHEALADNQLSLS